MSQNSAAIRRLKKDYRAIQRNPVDNITVYYDPQDIFTWYFLIKINEEPYINGEYIGKLLFPTDFPQSPPGIMILTPNGRFETNKRICMSLSDFHPESWSCIWTVSAVLKGIYSFWWDNDKTSIGAVRAPCNETKIKYAQTSKNYNSNLDIYQKFINSE